MTVKEKDMESLEQVTKNMVNDPSTWPHFWMLPLKNYKRKDGTGMAQLGYILEGAPYQIRSGNVFNPQESDPVIATYSSVEELIKDGWVVD